MLKYRVLVIAFLLSHYSLSAQLPNGSTAPDFTVNDINGNGFSLYSAMAGGKSTCVEFFKTSCTFCWHFHNSGVLHDVQSNLGYTTAVVMLEADLNTNVECFYGPNNCNDYTFGNWVAGANYQQVNLEPGNGEQIPGEYNFAYYPTLYVISPDYRTWLIDARTYQNYYNWIIHSFSLDATSTVSNSDCGDNGKIILNVTGGYSLLKYKWSNGAKTKDITNIPGGTYSVTVTDANGYFKSFGPWVVNGPVKRTTIINQNVTHNKCYGEQQGKIAINLDYGTAPYSYNWSNFEKTNPLLNLTAGDYKVTITDANNCNIVQTYVITEPNPITATLVKKDETCDEQNGSISIQAKGGVQPYEYVLGTKRQTTDQFINLTGGTYDVSIIDKNLCEKKQSITLSATHSPTIKLNTRDRINCVKDTALLNTSNGSSKGSEFSYHWSTKNGIIIGKINSLEVQAVRGGTYYFKITNTVNHCESNDSVIVDDIRYFPKISALNDASLDCNHIVKTLIGNTSDTGVQYYWTKLDDPFLDTSRMIQVSEAGKYVFNVKDTFSQCISKDTVDIVAYSELLLAGHHIVNINSSTPSGSIDIDIQGGRSPYRFEWSHGATSQQVKDLKAGIYFVKVIDANDCENTFGPFEVGALTSTNSTEKTEPFKLLPNPASSEIEITNKTSVSGHYLAGIYSLEQKLIKEFIIHTTRKNKVDLTGIPNGIYLIRILKDGATVQIQKLIIHK